MEQDLMWLKNKKFFKAAPVLSSLNTTWEEEAFAEDSAGPLGGFVWPPRSYSCTFCRREFRSAQALGGHMNVHRRDRARLKQYSLTLNHQQSTADHHQLHLKNPSTTFHPSQVGNFSSFFRASSKVTQENSSCKSQVFSPIVASKEQKTFSGKPTLSLISTSNSRAVTSGRKCTRKELLLTLDDTRERTTHVETNLTMGIHLRASHNNLPRVSNNIAEIAVGSKRHKKSSGISSSFALFHKPCSSNRYIFQTNSMDDIDLELRLGDSPAVK